MGLRWSGTGDSRRCGWARKTRIRKTGAGTSLAVQWLRLHTSSAGGPGSIPGQGTRSHMLHPVQPNKKNKHRSMFAIGSDGFVFSSKSSLGILVS